MCDALDAPDRLLAELRAAGSITGGRLTQRMALKGLCAPHVDKALRALARAGRIRSADGAPPLARGMTLSALADVPLTVVEPPTRVIAGRYEIRRVIGLGATATVYEALDRELGRAVALKELDLGRLSAEDCIPRFEREYRTLARLSHPNILQVHDAGRDGDRYFFVTELCAGSLADRVRSGGPLPVRDLVRVFLESLAGIRAAWEAGVLHRDLKPENLLADAAGRVRIADFGFVGFKSDLTAPSENDPKPLTEPGAVVGTVEFLPPELIQGQKADFRSDEYSLAASVYFLATGHLLYDRETGPGNRCEWIYAQENEAAVPLRTRRPEIPAELEAIILRCLAKSPGARYQTPRALEKDLRRFLATLPADASVAGTDLNDEALPSKPSGEMTEQVARVVVETQASIVGLQSEFREKHGADWSDNVAKLRPIWSLAKVRNVLGLFADLQRVVPAEQFAPSLFVTLDAVDAGRFPSSAVPTDPMEYLWTAVHQVEEAKADGLVPDTGRLEALERFLHDIVGHASIPKAGEGVRIPPVELPEAGESPERDPLIGQVINEKFKIIGLLGRGASGSVYLVEHLHLGGLFAVKLLNVTAATAFGEDREADERFQREGRIAAKLEHPNIVPIHDADFWVVETPFGRRRFRFLVMSYVEGTTLREYMDGHLGAGTLPPVSDVVAFGSQAFRGLSAAHGKGVVHRDIKPENLMVTRDGVLKIMDFGLARSAAKVDSITQSGKFSGTVRYAAPEQLDGKAEPRTDLYSTGVVLYELLSGKPAFAAPDGAEQPQLVVIAQIASGKTAPLHERRPDVPDALDRFVARLMAPDLNARFASAAEAVDELEKIAVALSATAPTTPPRRSRRPLPALAAVAAVLLAIGVTVALWHPKDAATKQPDGKQGDASDGKPNEPRKEPEKQPERGPEKTARRPATIGARWQQGALRVEGDAETRIEGPKAQITLRDGRRLELRYEEATPAFVVEAIDDGGDGKIALSDGASSYEMRRGDAVAFTARKTAGFDARVTAGEPKPMAGALPADAVSLTLAIEPWPTKEQPVEPTQKIPVAQILRTYRPTTNERALLEEMAAVLTRDIVALRSRSYDGATQKLEDLEGDPRQTEYTRRYHAAAKQLVLLSVRTVSARSRQLMEASGPVTVLLSNGQKLTGRVASHDDSSVTVTDAAEKSTRVALSDLASDDILDACRESSLAIAFLILSARPAEAPGRILAGAEALDERLPWIFFAARLADADAARMVAAGDYKGAKESLDELTTKREKVIDLFAFISVDFDRFQRESEALRLLQEDRWASVLADFDGTRAAPVAAKRLHESSSKNFSREELAADLMNWGLQPDVSDAERPKFYKSTTIDGVEVQMLRDWKGLRSLVANDAVKTAPQGIALTFRITFGTEHPSPHFRVSLESAKGATQLRLDAKEARLHLMKADGKAEDEIVARGPVPAAEKDAWRSLVILPVPEVKRTFVYVDGTLVLNVPLEDAAIPRKFALSVVGAEALLATLKVAPPAEK